MPPTQERHDEGCLKRSGKRSSCVSVEAQRKAHEACPDAAIHQRGNGAEKNETRVNPLTTTLYRNIYVPLFPSDLLPKWECSPKRVKVLA